MRCLASVVLLQLEGLQNHVLVVKLNRSSMVNCWKPLHSWNERAVLLLAKAARHVSPMHCAGELLGNRRQSLGHQWFGSSVAECFAPSLLHLLRYTKHCGDKIVSFSCSTLMCVCVLCGFPQPAPGNPHCPTNTHCCYLKANIAQAKPSQLNLTSGTAQVGCGGKCSTSEGRGNVLYFAFCVVQQSWF